MVAEITCEELKKKILFTWFEVILGLKVYVGKSDLVPVGDFRSDKFGRIGKYFGMQNSFFQKVSLQTNLEKNPQKLLLYLFIGCEF